VLTRYRSQINDLPASAVRTLSKHYGPPLPRRSMYAHLADLGAMQSDIVLILLRAGHRRAAEGVAGFAITTCPPALAGRAEKSPPADPDERLVVASVAPNPRLPTTGAFQRYREFRVGRSVRTLLSRGVTRKDIREVQQRGLVVFQPARRRA
jgi:hypothetical protein